MGSRALRAWRSTCSLAALQGTPATRRASLPTMKKTMHIHLLQLGRIPYSEGIRVMNEVVAARKAGRIGDTLLLLEHEPVLTLGRNATRANILASDEALAAKGVELQEINR